MEEFKLGKYAKEGAKLLRDVTAEFNRLELDTSALPKTFPDDDGKIKLVFVGQYSAGKSSLIKMLTGENVAIGAAITTQTSTPYEWNGLEIIDTPGIHTELRPDHDKITYEQINHAALLIFVITNEGFSQRMGDHFRELAINQKRAANMVLVVNKMDRTARGNVPEQQKIICADLKKVTTPYEPQDLYLSFTDTESYFKVFQETDERRKTRRLERSGREIFISNLNRFVAEKGVLQKINLPLNTIADILRSLINSIDNEKNNAVVVFKESFEHRKNLVLDGKAQCLREVKDLLNRFKNDVGTIGRKAADAAINSGDRENAQTILAQANEQVATVVEKYSNRLNECMSLAFSNVGTELINYENSPFIQQVNHNMSEQVATEIKFGKALPGGALAALGALTARYGAQIAAPYAVVATKTITQVVPSQFNAIFGKIVNWGSTAGLTSLGVPAGYSKVAGSVLGEGAESLGIFTETVTKVVPLPPTATNKIAQFVSNNAAKIGTVIGILGVAWSAYSLYSDNEQQRENEIKQRQIREEIIARFNETAEDTAAQMFDNAQKWIAQNIDPTLKNFNDAIKKIEDDKQKSITLKTKLSEFLERAENLIDDIQQIN